MANRPDAKRDRENQQGFRYINKRPSDCLRALPRANHDAMRRFYQSFGLLHHLDTARAANPEFARPAPRKGPEIYLAGRGTWKWNGPAAPTTSFVSSVCGLACLGDSLTSVP